MSNLHPDTFYHVYRYKMTSTTVDKLKQTDEIVKFFKQLGIKNLLNIGRDHTVL